MKHFAVRVLGVILVISESMAFRMKHQRYKGLSSQGRRAQFEAKDFVFNLSGRNPITMGLGGSVRPLDVDSLPSLEGLGVALAVTELEPCGINSPHVHPRATEMIYVVRGTNLRTVFVEENGGRAIVNDISVGDVTFFPQGLIHYQQNLGCSTITFLSALSSDDPGILTLASQLFLIPDNGAISAFLNISETQVQAIRSGLPVNPAEGLMECKNKCNMG